jgi:glycosyltransferase involved in cell wall biosynthesis
MTDGEAQTRILLLGDARQVHVARWARYLASVGYRVLTVSLESSHHVPEPNRRIRVPGLLPRFVRYPLAVPAVRRLIADFAPHVVNAHFLPNYGVIAGMTGFSPWVLSVWGSDVMLLPEKSPFHMRRTRWVIDRATFITSDSEGMTTRLVELGAAPERVVTFPYGVDRERFCPTGEPAEGPAPRIISSRKLEAVYDIRTVLSAFIALSARLPAACLTVAGDGSRAETLRRQAAESAQPESIRFVGNVVHDDMPALLRAHDVYVSMSLSDTTSVSLLEAMSCGLLPIVSDIPANREWVQHRSNGLLVPVGDAAALQRAMEGAWGDPGFRKAAAETNMHIIEQRADWFNNMSMATALFERLTGRRPPNVT